MRRSLATSAIALILGAGSALAELTPTQVWENVERSLTDSGSVVSIGAREENAQRLVLDNVVVNSADDTTESFSMTFPRMVFEDAGSGQVRSVIEGDTRIVMQGTDPEGERTGFDAVVEMPGNQTLSSGTADDMRHVYTIPTLRVTGTAGDAEGTAPLVLTMTEIAGDQTVRTTEGGGNTQSYAITAAAMGLTITAAGQPAVEPSDEATDAPAEQAAPADRFAATVNAEGLTLAGNSTTPAGGLGLDGDPGAVLRAGMLAEGTFGIGPISGSFESETTDYFGERQSGRGTFAMDTAQIDVALSAVGLGFGSSATNMRVNMEGSEAGFPLAYSVAEAAARLTLPLLADEAEQPFALAYTLDGVVLDDELWAMLDPEGALPRDPASLAVDIEGQAVLTADLMNAEATQREEMPFQPRSIQINRMSLDAIGATAQAEGALTFGDDPTRPMGRLTADMTGINALLDTLVAMGALPADQVMGTRMMMAMFARPVDGDQNRLQTELEFREDGSIFANGQQVQ